MSMGTSPENESSRPRVRAPAGSHSLSLRTPAPPGPRTGAEVGSRPDSPLHGT